MMKNKITIKTYVFESYAEAEKKAKETGESVLFNARDGQYYVIVNESNKN